MAKDSPTVTSFLDRILSVNIPGTNMSLAALLLGVLALFGAIPTFKHFLSMVIPDPVLLGVVTMLLGALTVYALIKAETRSEWLRRHPLAFVLITLVVVVLGYIYIPAFKEVLAPEVTQTIGQVVTYIVAR